MMLSKDECLSIVRKSLNENCNFKLIDFDIVKASDDNVGYLGEYFNLIAEIESDSAKIQKLRFFIKTVPQTNLQHRQIVQEIGVFRKEERIYKLFLEWDKFSTVAFHPKCFLSKTDLIVLEDLSLTGYYQLDNGVEYDLSHLEAVLKSLACMHATSIAYEVNNDVCIGDQMIDELFETSVSKDVTWYMAGLEAVKYIASQHPNFQSPAHQQLIANDLLQKLDPVCDMANASAKYRNVLCHRDVWGRNIFFKCGDGGGDSNNNENDPKSISSILVDYQTCKYCPPAIDILFLLHLNAPKSLRDKIHSECLRFYHQMLEQNLKCLQIGAQHHISCAEIFESCKDFKMFGIVYDCIAATITKLPKGYLNDLKLNHHQKYYKFANQSRIDVVSEFLQNDEHYRAYLFDAVEELMQLIL